MMRALICEDSPTYAAALRRMLEHDGDITVAATCGSAEEALAVLPAVQPDIVTMDIELPGMDGLQAIEEIMGTRPLPILVLLSTVADRRDKAAAALAAGALDVLAKDDLDLSAAGEAAGAAFRQRVKVLSRAHVIHHPRARLRGAHPDRIATAHRASVIGICASTGGPQIVVRLLEALPADYPIPLLIVQHITPGFTDGLASWLGQAVRVPIGVVDGETQAGPGAWIAPEGAHLLLEANGQLRLDRRPSGRHQPSGDVLFRSIAAVAGRTGVGIVLSGMGSDGAAGAAAIQRTGGLAIAQDEETSAIYGMPKAAVEAGVSLVLPPDQIATRLVDLQPVPLVRGR